MTTAGFTRSARWPAAMSWLPIVMLPIRGKGRTRRMRDLPFWARFFQLAPG